MKVIGVDFGPVCNGSGTQGFFGEGYWYHKLWRPFGLNFDGCTFTAKTTTYAPREGNMPLNEKYKPREMFPKCIIVKASKGIALNAVGLSSPGAQALLETGLWQKREKPFWLSFMAVEKTREKRQEELVAFINLLLDNKKHFKAPFGLQINFSCPNAGHQQEHFDDEFVNEIKFALSFAGSLRMPLMPKFNALVPIHLAKKISKHDYCDALCISNTIPWGSMPDLIDWKKLFGSNKSPLSEFGGGGLSGAPLLPLVAQWIIRARDAGITVPINAGGGILKEEDVHLMKKAGADSIFIGSVAMLKPWKVKSIIKEAHKVFGKQK